MEKKEDLAGAVFMSFVLIGAAVAIALSKIIEDSRPKLPPDVPLR